MKKPSPNLSPGVNFNSGEKTADVRNQAREKRDTPVPEGMGQAMTLPGMEAGVDKKDLPSIPGCRVMLKDRLYIPPDAPDKLHQLLPLENHVSSSTRATA
jgi:hypothetical protein